MARGNQAEFLGTISAYLDRSDTPTDFDEALNENLGVLLKACVDVRQLRTSFPPAVESNWIPAINAIIDAALEPYAWAFQNPNVRHGEPRPQALPRRFGRVNSKPVFDDKNLPRQFQPNRGFYIDYPLSGAAQPLSSRQLRCVNTLKKVDYSTSTATISVIVSEVKASAADLPIAKGQALYSAVAAAGIAENLDEDTRTLVLPIAHGFAFPQIACWPGKLSSSSMTEGQVAQIRKADLYLLHGERLNLGNLYDAVRLFVMLSAAARYHVRRLFPEGVDDMRTIEYQELYHPQNAPKRRILEPKALVDWRARVTPEYDGRKRTASSPGNESRPLKKVKTEDETYEVKSEDEEEGDAGLGSDSEVKEQEDKGAGGG
ncbi:hypothetical protein C8R46DRAFT_337639 [Mycena filopes]|nr:hypothetical protein C8R46DRAFT_337639 [Mycena filopes]